MHVLTRNLLVALRTESMACRRGNPPRHLVINHVAVCRRDWEWAGYPDADYEAPATVDADAPTV